MPPPTTSRIAAKLYLTKQMASCVKTFSLQVIVSSNFLAHRLSRPSLSTSHEVSLLGNNGDGKLLDWGGSNITAFFNIPPCCFKKVTLFKCFDTVRRVLARYLHGDFIILVKVYPSCHCRENTVFIFWGRRGNVELTGRT